MTPISMTTETRTRKRAAQIVPVVIATAVSGTFALPFAWASRYDMNPDGISYTYIGKQVAVHSD